MSEEKLDLKSYEKISKYFEELSNKNCVMNSIGYISHMKVKKVYKCKCLGVEMIMCQFCATKCHKGHEVECDEKEYSSFKCMCANEKHEVGKLISKNSNHLKEECMYMTIFNQSQIKSFYQDPNNDTNRLCFFCKEPNSNLNFQITTLKNDNTLSFGCNCSDHDSHLLFDADKNPYTTSLFGNINLSAHFNQDQITFALIENPNLVSFFLHKLQDKSKDILKMIKDDNYQEYQKERDPLYNSLNRFLVDSCKYSPHITNLIKNVEFKKCFDFEFLEQIYTTVEISKDYFTRVKFFALHNFRVFHILPRIQNKFSSFIDIAHNTNFFHRLLLQQSIEEFCSQINIKLNIFEKFFRKVVDSTLFYIKNLKSSNVGEKQEERTKELIGETIQYIKLLINFNMSIELLSFLADSLENITRDISSNIY
jgi:hypothetical protein